MTHWYQLDDTGLTLHIHAQPGAKQSEIIGLHGSRLKIKLKAPAIEGKANAALIEFLATLCQIPKSRITLISGHESRQKRIKILGIQSLPSFLLLI